MGVVEWTRKKKTAAAHEQARKLMGAVDDEDTAAVVDEEEGYMHTSLEAQEGGELLVVDLGDLHIIYILMLSH